MVMAWIRRIRWSVADAGAGNTEFIAKHYDTIAEKQYRERAAGSAQGGGSAIAVAMLRFRV
jgi:hypothetical protein